MTKSTRTLRFPRTQSLPDVLGVFCIKSWWEFEGVMEIDGVVLTGALFAGGTRSWCTKADGRVTCMPCCSLFGRCAFLHFCWVEHGWRTGNYRKPVSFTSCAMCKMIVYVKCMGCFFEGWDSCRRVMLFLWHFTHEDPWSSTFMTLTIFTREISTMITCEGWICLWIALNSSMSSMRMVSLEGSVDHGGSDLFTLVALNVQAP